MRYRRVMTRYVRLVPIRESLPYFDVLRALAPVVSIAPLHWRPPADVCETASSITVVLDVAGLDEDAIDVELYEDALVIEGMRRIDACGPNGSYLAAEIRQGRFHVEVDLPTAVDSEGVNATYERGLLRVELSKVGARRANAPIAGAGRGAVAGEGTPGDGRRGRHLTMAANAPAQTPTPIPDLLPVLPVRGLVSLPRGHRPGDDRPRAGASLVDDAMRTNRLVLVVGQRDPGQPRNPSPRTCTTSARSPPSSSSCACRTPASGSPCRASSGCGSRRSCRREPYLVARLATHPEPRP